MNNVLPHEFEYSVELMVLWMRQWEIFVLEHGVALDAKEIEWARCAGVVSPEKVRVLVVPNVPLPAQEILQTILVRSNLLNPAAYGLAVGYGVFLKYDAFPRQYFLAHELVHTAQQERMGTTPAVRQYLRELLDAGYFASSLEQEAHHTALKCLEKAGITFDFEIEWES